MTPEVKRHILSRLNAAEAFETFLHLRYVGQKRFGLEGAESAIPFLDAVLDAAAHAGIAEVVLGMAHRGRLNVLANIVGKSYGEIFGEFEGNLDPETVQGSGDVKYHKGAVGRWRGRDGTSLARLARVEPVAPRGSRPRRRGDRAAPSRIGSPIRRPSPSCRSSSTATPRSPGRASSPRRSTCRSCTATAPAARSTSSSTTSSASRHPRPRHVRRCTRPTSPRWSSRRSST